MVSFDFEISRVDCTDVKNYRISSVIRWSLFSFQNNPKI